MSERSDDFLELPSHVSAILSSMGGAGAEGKSRPWEDEESELALRERQKRPRRYRVLLHNDDYTSMEFVVRILQQYFHKNATEAHHLMLQVHYKGQALAGVYAKDVAETKIKDVTADAEAHEMPLRCSMEPL